MAKKKTTAPGNQDGSSGGSGKDLTPLQHRFVESMLLGRSIADAARLSGCSLRAAFNWMRDDSPVRQAYEARRLAATEAFDQRISRLHDAALTAMEDLLSARMPPFVRVQAARVIYEKHIAPHADLLRPQTPLELVDEGVSQYHDEAFKWRLTDALLYDAKGEERIEDD